MTDTNSGPTKTREVTRGIQKKKKKANPDLSPGRPLLYISPVVFHSNEPVGVSPLADGDKQECGSVGELVDEARKSPPT